MIANGIIDAKIDQLKQEIVIKGHNMRTYGADEWSDIKSTVSEWRERFERLQSVLHHQQQITTVQK